LPNVPVIIKDVDDEQAAIMALIENIQREDLNPLEEARALKRLLEEFALTHEQIAETVGRSRSATSNLLRLLNLAQPVQEMLIQNKLEMGHARALLSLEAAQQIQVATLVHAKALSVRQTEQLVAKGSNLSRGDRPTMPKQSSDALRMQERLCDHLGTAVLLKASSKGKGQLVMQFHDWEQFHGLLEKLGMSDLIKED
jgi:ParB family transcriptional regulator, chromosome partitioning protein